MDGMAGVGCVVLSDDWFQIKVILTLRMYNNTSPMARKNKPQI